MRFAGLTICLVLVVAGSGCRVGLVAEAPEVKNTIEGSDEAAPGQPIAGPTGSAGGANGGIPPTGDILPTILPSANVQVASSDVGSVVVRSENYTTLVTIGWTSGGVSATTAPINLSIGQKKFKGGKP